MKAKLAYVILLGLILVGGLLFLIRSRNRTPVIPVVPKGAESNSPVLEQTAPTNTAKVTQEVESTSSQSSATEKIAIPGTATGTITAFTITPTLKPGTSQQTPTPTTPILLITPTMTPIEGLVGKSPTPPGRLSPDYLAEPLKFTQIRIFMNDAGVFSGLANVSNTGETFLNALVIKWRIMDKSGNILDQGQLSWPNLAPGETATVSFVGTNPYNDLWEKVTFEFKP